MNTTSILIHLQKLAKFQMAEDERRLSQMSIKEDTTDPGGIDSDEETDPAPSRPMTGKEARRMRSAKVKKDIEDNSLAYDDDFYK